jgi:hypothetical protein
VGLHLAALYLWQVPLAHTPQLQAAGAAVGLFTLAWGAPHLALQLALLALLHVLYAVLGAYRALARSPEYRRQRRAAAARGGGDPAAGWGALVAQELSLHPAPSPGVAGVAEQQQQTSGGGGTALGGGPPARAASRLLPLPSPPLSPPLSPWLSMKGRQPPGQAEQEALGSTPPGSSGRLPAVELSAVQAAGAPGGGNSSSPAAPVPASQQLERQHSLQQQHPHPQQHPEQYRQRLDGWARGRKLLQLLLPLLASVAVAAFEGLTSAPVTAAMAMCCLSMARVSALGSATLLAGLAALLLPSRCGACCAAWAAAA